MIVKLNMCLTVVLSLLICLDALTTLVLLSLGGTEVGPMGFGVTQVGILGLAMGALLVSVFCSSKVRGAKEMAGFLMTMIIWRLIPVVTNFAIILTLVRWTG